MKSIVVVFMCVLAVPAAGQEPDSPLVKQCRAMLHCYDPDSEYC